MWLTEEHRQYIRQRLKDFWNDIDAETRRALIEKLRQGRLRYFQTHDENKYNNFINKYKFNYFIGRNV